MNLLKHNTASQIIPLGFYLDNADGDTEETGLTIANTDIWIWKEGATSLVDKNSGGATHMQNGIYCATLDATDTNTLGKIRIFTHVSGALVVLWEGLVVPLSTYDAIITNGLNNIAATEIVTSGAITTSSGSVSSVITTANLTANNDKSGYLISGTKTTLDSLNDISATQIVSSGPITTSSGSVASVNLVDVCTSNTDMVGTDNALLASSYTAPDNATINSIDTKVDVLGLVTADTNTKVTTIETNYSTFNSSIDQVIVGTNNDKTGYSISGAVDANIITINGFSVLGDGSSDNLWRGNP